MTLYSLLFLLFFLPTFVVFYFPARTVKQKNAILLFFSIIFYSFAGLPYLLLLIMLSLIAFFAARNIEEARSVNKHKHLVFSVIIFISVLCIFKYTNFLWINLKPVFNFDFELPEIVLPLGISFYIFKLISYVTDVYREETEAERDFSTFLLYVIMFFTVIQGPITRYSDMKYELNDRHAGSHDIADGIFRFQIGLAKKTVLADKIGILAGTLAPVSDSVNSASMLAIWAGSICFSLQIYLDFSAYCDMAIGFGKILGFDIPENFNYPYAATSMKDFWRRWHISLSSFFRDYLYIPLGGNRVSAPKFALNLLIVWILTGMWHGASINFIFWGLFYLPFILVEHALGKLNISPPPRFIRHIYTIFVANLGCVFFRFTNLSALKSVLSTFFGAGNKELFNPTVLINLQNNVFLIIACIICATPLFRFLDEFLREKAYNDGKKEAILSLSKTIIGLFFLFISLLSTVSGSFTPFLYNQF